MCVRFCPWIVVATPVFPILRATVISNAWLRWAAAATESSRLLHRLNQLIQMEFSETLPHNLPSGRIFKVITSNLVSCLFVSAIVSKPYIMPDRTAVRWSFPFNLADACLSHSSPVIFPRQPRQRCHVSLIPSILSWSVKWPKRYAMLWRKIRQWKSEKRGS